MSGDLIFTQRKLRDLTREQIAEIYRECEPLDLPGWASVHALYEAMAREGGETPLTMHQFDASEGGRKCVECCKYRREVFLRSPPETDHIHMRVGGSPVRISVTLTPVCEPCIRKMEAPHET